MAMAAAMLAGCGERASTMADINSTDVTLANGTKLVCQTMKEDIDLTRGLMFLDSLPPGHGMLFEYPLQRPHPAWMYQVKFAIDAIWMDNNHSIDQMVLNIPPCIGHPAHECPHYGGDRNSSFMLQAPAGFVKQQGLKIGDRLDF